MDVEFQTGPLLTQCSRPGKLIGLQGADKGLAATGVAHLIRGGAVGSLGGGGWQQNRMGTTLLYRLPGSHAVLQQHDTGIRSEPVPDGLDCRPGLVGFDGDQQVLNRGRVLRFGCKLELLTVIGFHQFHRVLFAVAGAAYQMDGKPRPLQMAGKQRADGPGTKDVPGCLHEVLVNAVSRYASVSPSSGRCPGHWEFVAG